MESGKTVGLKGMKLYFGEKPGLAENSIRLMFSTPLVTRIRHPYCKNVPRSYLGPQSARTRSRTGPNYLMSTPPSPTKSIAENLNFLGLPVVSE